MNWKYIILFLRNAGFAAVNLVLKWPILGILACVRFLKPFDYLFLVYPGTDDDLAGYCPKFFAKSRLFSGKISLGGVISKGAAGRGLVLVMPNTAMELLRKKALCQNLLNQLEELKNLIGAESVAVAGQFPGIAKRHGLNLDRPFVRGNKGTVFCVIETINEAAKKHGLVAGKFKIGVVGVGYVGGLLVSSLEEMGHDVFGIDVTIARRGVILPENGKSLLREADMVVILTPRGSDFIPYVENLKSGSIVIDDTHPRIDGKLSGITFYKVAAGMKDVRFYPELPGYKADWIPGCAVEAIYSAATGKFNGLSQEEFNKKAKELGFFARLVN